MTMTNVLLLVVMQVPAGQPNIALSNDLKVARTPSGDYEVSYKLGAELKSFVLVPATKTDPAVRTNVTRVNDRFQYEYALENGPASRQAINAVSLHVVGIKSEDVMTPAGWRPILTPERERMSWMKPPTGPQAPLDGLAPGAVMDGFKIIATALPAPDEWRVYGNAEPFRFPTDFPASHRAQLERSMVMRNAVIAWAITPSIRIPTNEPELTAAVFISRILGAYARAFELSRHPARLEIVAALSEAVQHADTDRERGRLAVDRARSLAADGALDSWSKELGRGLAVCLDFVLSRFRI